MHPSEEDLVLLFYDDTNTVDAAAVPEPPADFERVMWARVQGAIDGLAAPRTPWWAPRFWMPAATLAAVFVAMFMVGRMWPIAGVTTPDVTASGDNQSERALQVAMDDHLERSELLGRATADDLLSSSRLYRQTATQSGNVQLAAMLEDLERVLVEIARAPDDLKREDLDTLRSRIKQDDLIFKVRVVKTISGN